MTKSEWMDFFNEEARKYDNNAFTHNTLNEVDFLEKELGLPNGASILAIDCGSVGKGGMG